MPQQKSRYVKQKGKHIVILQMDRIAFRDAVAVDLAI